MVSCVPYGTNCLALYLSPYMWMPYGINCRAFFLSPFLYFFIFLKNIIFSCEMAYVGINAVPCLHTCECHTASIVVRSTCLHRFYFFIFFFNIIFSCEMANVVINARSPSVACSCAASPSASSLLVFSWRHVLAMDTGSEGQCGDT